MAKKPKAKATKGAKPVVGLNKSGSPDRIMDRFGGGTLVDRGIKKKGDGWKNQ